MPPACNSHNLDYLITKREKMGHWLDGLDDVGAKETGSETVVERVQMESSNV